MGVGVFYAGGKHDTTWGYIDKAGHAVIAPQFDAAGDFRGGLAWVDVSGTECRYNDIDRTGAFLFGGQPP